MRAALRVAARTFYVSVHLREQSVVPISRGKQVCGVLGAIACSYAISWMLTPGPGTGPVDSFGPAFAGTAAPIVIMRPKPEHRAAEPAISLPEPLQASRNTPI
jgi:hypothetical protein